LRERKLIVGCAGENPKHQRILKLQIPNGGLMRWSLDPGACLVFRAGDL